LEGHLSGALADGDEAAGGESVEGALDGAAVLESEKRVLDEVQDKYVRKDVCTERHDGHPARRRRAVEVGDEA
jgi:hypothetical protein